MSTFASNMSGILFPFAMSKDIALMVECGLMKAELQNTITYLIRKNIGNVHTCKQ
jgi:hypothetical protein